MLRLNDILNYLTTKKQMYMNKKPVGTPHWTQRAPTSEAKMFDGHNHKNHKHYIAWVDEECSVEKLLV
jgi:hypothetical protein